MARHKEWDDDDGRTIADMSGIERPRFLIPKVTMRKSASLAQGTKERIIEDRPWESENELTPSERRMYVLGALKAAILIALAFIVGLGAAVWLMLLAWT